MMIFPRHLLLVAFAIALISCGDPESGATGKSNSTPSQAAQPATVPRLLLIREGDLFIAEFPDGEPRLLIKHDDPTLTRHEMRSVNGGKGLFYSSFDKKSDFGRDYWLLDLSNGQRELLFSRRDWFDREPSPDGRWLAVMPGDDMTRSGPLTLEDIHGGRIKEVAGTEGPFFFSYFNFHWSEKGDRLLVLKRNHESGDGSPPSPPELTEYKVPKMKARSLNDYLPRDKALLRLWVEEDGWVVTIIGQTNQNGDVAGRSCKAFHPDSGKIKEMTLPECDSIAIIKAPRPREFYMIVPEKLIHARWDTQEMTEFKAPAGADTFSPYYSVSAVTYKDQDYLLFEKTQGSTPDDADAALHAAPVGGAETRILHQGFRLVMTLN